MPIIVTKQDIEARGGKYTMGNAVPAAHAPMPALDPIDSAAAAIARLQADKNKRLDELQKAWEKNTAQVADLIKAQAAAAVETHALIAAQEETNRRLRELSNQYDSGVETTTGIDKAVTSFTAQAAKSNGERNQNIVKLLASQSEQIRVLEKIRAAQDERIGLIAEIAGLEGRNDKRLSAIIGVLSTYSGAWKAKVRSRDTHGRILELEFSEMQ
jgi:hypothetical protein